MPLWLRKFVYQKIRDHYNKQAEEVQKAKDNKGNKQNLINPDGTVRVPTKSSYK